MGKLVQESKIGRNSLKSTTPTQTVHLTEIDYVKSDKAKLILKLKQNMIKDEQIGTQTLATKNKKNGNKDAYFAALRKPSLKANHRHIHEIHFQHDKLPAASYCRTKP